MHAAVALFLPLTLGQTPPVDLDPRLLAGMQARAIGPAAMSGRVAAIDALAADPNQIYVGAATGGLWRSRDAGLTWEALFDDQPVHSIGAVAVHQGNPDLIWVGTGEGNPRNSASVGNGVYKSADGGRDWKHLGLDDTERIHRILLHPTDPRIAWVAALGREWGENHARGVFKTEDGGATWNHVLYVDERTGCADLAADPRNPDKLFAAMWDYRRWPWFFRSGGPGSGLYRSHDGGASWERLGAADGLPEGELGRIGVAVAPSDPEVVYAYVEARDNAVYRSADGGRSWSKVSQGEHAGDRPFYYADLRVDPRNPNRVYSLWSQVSVSEDGGRSFRVLVGWDHAHPDHHALWIHPGDPRHLIDGNDGGISISRDGGASWSFARNLPIGQFYHVRLDLDLPYHVYGGMQDNGSWRGPSQVWENGGIRNHHWQEVGFGDGFDTAPDPDDSLRGYAMSQEGYLMRWNLRSGERKDIRPAPPPGAELRFNWNAGFAQDPFDPATIYYGSQFVHRSTDRGDTWQIISPDLTTDNPEWQKQADSGGLTPDVTGAENYTTILAIAPSPVQRGVVWVGSDDGRLHLTRDGGRSWTSVGENVYGVPPHAWIPHVEPSPHDPAAAFVVFDDHRRSNWTPYVYKTSDFGASWTSLAGGGIRGYALCIVQDPVEKDLLFLGTEFGLWVSRDGGRSWFQWRHGLPTSSVMDLAIHPRDHDLVIATHGRSIYILDDIRPLRRLSAATLEQPLALYGAADAVQHRRSTSASSRFPGQGEFRGANRPYGAIITFSVNDPALPHPDDEVEKERGAGRGGPQEGEGGGGAAGRTDPEDEANRNRATIRVTDLERRPLRTFKTELKQGLNRAVWDLRMDGYAEPSRERPKEPEKPAGFEVAPGDYLVSVEYGGHQAEAPLRVLPDPRSTVSAADQRANLEARRRAGRVQETIAQALWRLQDTRRDVDAILELHQRSKSAASGAAPAPAEESEDGLEKAARELKDELERLEKLLWTPPDAKGIAAERHVHAHATRARSALSSSWERPNANQERLLELAEQELNAFLAELNRCYAEQVAAFHQLMHEQRLELLPLLPPLAIQ